MAVIVRFWLEPACWLLLPETTKREGVPTLIVTFPAVVPVFPVAAVAVNVPAPTVPVYLIFPVRFATPLEKSEPWLRILFDAALQGGDRFCGGK